MGRRLKLLICLLSLSTEVREAFFRLAKRFHPDTGTAEADGNKFAAVKDAYKIVMESGTVEGVGTPNVNPGA